MNRKRINKELYKKIKQYKSIIIAKHTYPDWDAQGSAIGLANIINDNFFNKNIYVVGDRLDQNPNFVPTDLTKEKIAKSLLITVDTANTERIDFQQWKDAKEVFKIDHHPNVDNYGTYNMVDDSSIACCQIITLWANRMKLKISTEAATNLYKGLLTDSGRFLFDKTDSRTFKAAGILVDQKVSLTDIQNSLYTSSLEMRKWQNQCFAKMQLSQQNVGYIIVKEQDYQGLNLSKDDIKSCLFTMAGIKEIPIWCTIIEMDNKIKVSLRSREYNVNSVATKYNGGGHLLASGASLDSFKDVDKLINDLDKLVENKITK